MKILLAILLSLCAAAIGATPLVNDRTTDATAEDSLTVLFWASDSLGAVVATDSLFIAVTGPTGSVTFAETTTVIDNRVTSLALGGANLYTWREQVATLTNGGAPGLYRLVLLARAGSPPYRVSPHTGSFQFIGVSLSEQLVKIAGGRGLYSRTLLALDTASALGVPGVNVRVTNLSQTGIVAQGWTDLTGAMSVNLDAGSLLVVANSPGYVFPAYDTIIVSGGGCDTLPATRWLPVEPDVPLKTRVWGHVFNISGTAEVGAVVSVGIPAGVIRFNGVIISPFEVSTTTDANGFFQLDVFPSPLLDPPGTEYEFTIQRSDGAILRRRIVVPDAGLWRLTW